MWSRDEDDREGELVLCVVEEVFIRVAPIWELVVEGQVIETTREHPFDARGRGWTPAGELVAGDWVWTEEKRWARVEAVRDTGRVETVYNFRVARYHTYFVGCDEWGFSVWAHNAACTPDDIRRIAKDASDSDIDYAVKMINGEVRASRQGIHDYLEYMGAKPNEINPLLDQHGWHRPTNWTDHVGEGKLTREEAARIQAISDEFQTSVYVGGSRAAGEGREVFSTLPVGKGRGTRSDIDFRFDVLHPRADEIKSALNGVGTPGSNGKFPGNARDRHNINDPADPIRWPYLDFHPGGS